MSKTLVVYFSVTNTTKRLAEYASEILNADIYAIQAAEQYTAEDLAYYTDCRADREQNDPAARPAIAGSVEDMAKYDTILLGYPIWHGQAPRIISTFLESYDLSGKTILPFCTSHSSGIGTSDKDLHSFAAGANWLDGKRFAKDTTKETLADWLKEMMPAQTNSPEEETSEMKMIISVGGQEFAASLERNTAVDELIRILEQGPVTLHLRDYAGFEKVGPLGQSLPTSNRQITTHPGDIVLYQGNQIVMFYGTNSWSYTMLGHIDSLTAWETALGSGDVEVVLSLK